VARFRSALSVIGAVLTGAGVLILIFVAYQLWGTGFYTARQQGDLKAEFRTRAGTKPPTSGSTSTTNTTVALPPTPRGEPVAIIRIPKIGAEHAVVEGVTLADLRKGPGHYPGTPLPGEAGNAAVAGHRTTYGAPFNRLDELAPGDPIEITTVRGSYTYKVSESKVVLPSQVEVLAPTPDARLTLTTCNPKYSAKQRLVVVAALAPGQPPPPPPAPARPDGKVDGDKLADAGLGGPGDRIPTAAWAVATAVVGFLWWFAVRRRRRWTTYAAGVLPFLSVLLTFYSHVERLLPANF
jgi:sortase A